MISLSKEPQFSAEDIYVVPAEVGRTHCEFDMNLIEVCHPLFKECYDSHEVLANELIRAKVIRDSDLNISNKNAVVVRFKSLRASQAFINRLNIFIHKHWIKQ